ncbi:hypothetical protein RMSM_06259 [Rhodopirellula maiorica SM1]|uniref:Uncharacterized protein n=1 Tax=Rhodopirellula maiorica SM1 TaxID=1265738 RepID=M5RCP0_9BACT|nr:hypothetical protein RMSM_06259 [Rhodopirellula maiorica SM1]
MSLSLATAAGNACRVRTSSRISTYHITHLAASYSAIRITRSVICWLAAFLSARAFLAAWAALRICCFFSENASWLITTKFNPGIHGTINERSESSRRAHHGNVIL